MGGWVAGFGYLSFMMILVLPIVILRFDPCPCLNHLWMGSYLVCVYMGVLILSSTQSTGAFVLKNGVNGQVFPFCFVFHFFSLQTDQTTKQSRRWNQMDNQLTRQYRVRWQKVQAIFGK